MTSRPAKRIDRSERLRVREALERVIASPDFDTSRRSRDFLRFIVEEALAGRGEAITQAAIATRVFGRREDFDPVVDPIVRIQAGRLRRSLERYYLLSGAGDPLRIDLARGTYVPAFRPRAESEVADGPVRAPAAPASPPDDWPAVVVGVFERSAREGKQEALATRLEEELAAELGRYRDVRVVLRYELERLEPSRRAAARFTLSGRIRGADGDWLVTARLVDRATGGQVWAEEYGTAAGAGRAGGSPEDVARVIAAAIASEEGAVLQLLAGEYRKKPVESTPFAAILRSYDFFLARVPGSLVSAVEALRKVVAVEPECGPAWTRLARLCLANHAFEVAPILTPIDEAIGHALNGVRLEPASRRARCVLAAALLVKGELASARQEVEQALRLNPGSLVYLEMIGFLLTLLGDWERGPALCRTARERNPHCLPQVLIGLWFDHLRRGELESAYQAALEYRDPTSFWRAVMRASCLGLLGRVPEARSEVAEILRVKPDFTVRGRTLIGHYIKFPEVMSRIAEGLARAGLELA